MWKTRRDMQRWGGGLPSLILVALGARVMASENRSGVRPFTSNVRGDYTLIEVV